MKTTFQNNLNKYNIAYNRILYNEAKYKTIDNNYKSTIITKCKIIYLDKEEDKEIKIEIIEDNNTIEIESFNITMTKGIIKEIIIEYDNNYNNEYNYMIISKEKNNSSIIDTDIIIKNNIIKIKLHNDKEYTKLYCPIFKQII